MTKDELFTWVATHYFANWEIERAQSIAARATYEQAIEYLVENDEGRGQCGPDIPAFHKSGKRAKVKCYYPRNYVRSSNEPDLTISLEALARLALDDPQQPRLI